MRKIVSLISLLLVIQTVFGQITKVTLNTSVPRLYERTDWNIHLIAKWDNPYLQEDVALNMHIIAPSGKQLFLPCYYDSGSSGQNSLWKARFAPQETGRYQCFFQLRKNGKVVSRSVMKIFVVRTSDKDGFLHPKNDWVFQFDDGKPFRGLGEDIGWESRASDDSKYFKELNEKDKYNYEYMLHSLAVHGGNFFRTWMCRWNLPIDWHDHFNSNRYTPSNQYYNPSAVKRMDLLINLADSLGLHMMLTLGPGAYRVKDGGYATSAADFFVNPKSITRYKNRFRYIVARWGYSPAIGAWELFNEIDNVMYQDPNHPIDPAAIVKWHAEMSAYIKKIDPYHHMVTTSISYRDLPGLNSITDIDFNQKHIYRHTTSIPSTIRQYEQQFHKPYVIGEFSYEWDWTKNFSLFQNEMISDYKRGLWYGLFSPTPILPMSWWWEYFDSLKTDRYIIRIRTILDQMLAAGNGSFKEIQQSVTQPDFTTYGVKCGHTTFVYVYNPTDSSKKTAVTIEGSFHSLPLVKVYYCESGEYSYLRNAELAGDKLVIPKIGLAANSDVVFICREP